ncbi:MAG: 3-isopropylmalate dehydratase small subunit [Gammaproteobacteria bacterium]|nr:3-isopropylmalate dehydratase small subunit [Gammaproteobacteria bacterium]
MKPFTRHRGVAAPLIRVNIDTDTIIPSREMRRVSKHGLADGLFAGWRYLDTPGGKRENNPEFVLNKPHYAGATILLAGNNFGCGSSREHAAWALVEYGFRAVIAPGFGSIFHGNAVRNGLLPVKLPEPAIDALNEYASASPETNRILVDLENTTVRGAAGDEFGFVIEPAHREMLLQGLDAIAMTQQHLGLIEAFRAADRQRRGWAYLDAGQATTPALIKASISVSVKSSS